MGELSNQRLDLVRDRPDRLDRLTGAVPNLPIQVTPHPMVHDDIGDANGGEALRELRRHVAPRLGHRLGTAGFMRSADAEPAERTRTRPRGSCSSRVAATSDRPAL